MIGTVFAIVLCLGGLFLGLYISHRQAPLSAGPGGGWVYFLSAVSSDEERPSPIKIGMTRRDPATERLPEIATMSPEPLRVLYSFFTERPEAEELRIHTELKKFRQHGEWFERYPTLMYIDSLKGER